MVSYTMGQLVFETSYIIAFSPVIKCRISHQSPIRMAKNTRELIILASKFNISVNLNCDCLEFITRSIFYLNKSFLD